MDREQSIRLMQDLLRGWWRRRARTCHHGGLSPAIKIDGEIRPQSDRSLSANRARAWYAPS